nr:type VI secretion system baseplate subunit TssF [uncultured Desulfobulbus sp.]
MANRYYQEQLHNLRELAKEFSRTHPAVAPFLAGESRDPDVERLLEGVAFLTGLVSERIDDEVPELIHSLSSVLFPHHLCPIPSLAIVVFTPKPSLMETMRVPRGTFLDSRPIDGEPCRFQTCFDLDVHPLRIVRSTSRQRSATASTIELECELLNIELGQWQPKQFLLYLGGAFANASQLLFHLTRNLRQIALIPQKGGTPALLPPSALRPFGMTDESDLFPYPRRVFSGFQRLQEYLALPQKNLFLQLDGWEQWQQRGKGSRFQIHFELGGLNEDHPLPPLQDDSFILGATPVVNLFSLDAEPVPLTLSTPRVRINPSQRKSSNFSVYSIDRVVGFTRGTVQQRTYRPIDNFAKLEQEVPVYQVIQRISPVHGQVETFLDFSYPGNALLQTDETLAVDLTCTNGRLPEQLLLGDINRETSTSPGLLSFQNITAPTLHIDPPIAQGTLWKLISHLSLNLTSLGTVEGVRALLENYLSMHERDNQKVTAMRKRLEGLEEMTITPIDRVVRGIMLRGQEITLKLRCSNFSNVGDLCLFGSVLDLFLGEYSGLNCFTELVLIDIDSGEEFRWPTRLGNRSLI